MNRRMRLFGLVTCLIVALSLSITIGRAGSMETQLITAERDEDDAPRVDYHDETGMLAFIGADPQKPIRIAGAMRPGLLPADKAMAALNEYGPAFGIDDPSNELTLMKQNISEGGFSSTRYQQVYHGVPIIAGELIINIDSRGGLLSINGEVSPNLDLSTIPSVTTGEAKETALEATAKLYNLSLDELQTSEPELWIYDARLLKPSTRPEVLVWKIEVKGKERLEINELVLVDANLGVIPLHFNQIDSARNRMTYDAENGTSLPGTLRCDEANPTCSGGDPHEVAAHVNAGLTYDFYMTHHTRDSIDNAGMTLISTVHYDTDYVNAFWSGSQMVYGDGWAFPLGIDVVGHELTHGVTQYTSNLFYYYQSGAINESLSDVWGEFVDKSNGVDDDTGWLMGEDIPPPGGAIRSMKNPTFYGDPDYMGSGNYWCAETDQGGVHINSGVNNKAVYLMTDGDSFRGKTVTALGMDNVADLYYAVQTQYLTSGSNYNDLYNVLIQASKVLGFTAAEQQEVQDALDAVSMNQRPCGDAAEPSVCPSGLSPLPIFYDDLENPSSGNWITGANIGSNWWFYPQNPNFGYDMTYTSSGIYNFWGYDYSGIADYYIAMTSDVTLRDNSYMHFRHDWNFEEATPVIGWDGGVFEYSINSGGSWLDTAPMFTHNGYNGIINSSSNPLDGRLAFVGESHGYTSSRLDLSGFSAGTTVRFRFRIGTDSLLDDYGWYVDDIQIYTCGIPMYLPLITK